MTGEARDPAHLVVMAAAEGDPLAAGFDLIPCFRVAQRCVRAFDLSADNHGSRGEFHLERRRPSRPVYHCIDLALPGVFKDIGRTAVLNANLATRGEA